MPYYSGPIDLPPTEGCPDGYVLRWTTAGGFQYVAPASGPGGTTYWGSIEGAIASQIDLQTALDGKAGASHTHPGVYAPAVHTHVQGDVAGLVAALAGKADTGHTHLGIPTVALKASDQTAIGNAYADVTGTGLAVLASTTYAFEFALLCDADAATTGIDVACNGPAGAVVEYEQIYWTSATARTERHANAYNANTASTGSNGAARRWYRVRGVLINGVNAGTLIARAKRENVGSGPNVRAGSYGVLWKLS